jgi:gliding motility-associated-like protein
MKSALKFLIGLAFVLPGLSWSQSNDCSTATTLPVTANCSSPLAGTTSGATQSIAGCSGTADDDVWYQFTATATTHQINVTASAGFDPVVQVFSGACASLISLLCTDLGFAGENETCYLSGLSIGQVYKVRIYHYAAGSGTSTFTICCTVGATVPSNNNCSGATPLTVNTVCSPTAGTTLGATQSVAGCSGTADDDVWYSFVATNASQTVTVTPTTSTFDAVVQVYSGTCAALTSEACIDATFSDDPETQQLVGLTPGQTYFIRVYDYYVSNPGTFTICITGPATATPTNDNPCTAIALPPVSSDCNYLEFTTVGATNTASPGAPSSCIGGSGAAQGGFTAGTLDVWFSIVVPASGNLYITPKPNMGAGRISDGVMVLYSGTCGSLTQVVCSDDNAFPGTANDLLPFIAATGLTPGSTVYLRFFGYGTSSGTFGLCVTTATNDVCSNALYICDLNGYSASTSAAFTADRPCNMRGNAEQNNAPTYTYTPGTDQGGIFGSGGAWGTGGSPDVQINNNSWIRFTAASATAVLNVSVSDCWVGNYPSGGIQMQVFSSNGACCNFTPVSNFEENSTSFTITANGLTPGQDYYLMVDGFAGDICNYTITAQSGVQFPAITPVPPICFGQSVVLNAPAGGTSYDWAHNGASSQSVNVTPATTQSYSVDVYGICGYKQTLTTTVTVNPIPAAPVLGSNQTVCTGNTLNLTAATVSGATYSWTGPNSFSSSLQNPSISNVSALAAGTYSCTVTVNGCTSPASNTTVTVNTTPAAPIVSSNTPVCTGNTINLFANNVVGATYLWSGPASFSSTLEDPTRPSATAAMAGTYTCQITVNGCPSSANTSVVINTTPAAPIAGSNSAICSGQTLNLTASNVVGATSYSWTGPNSFTSSSQNPNIASATTAASGIYTVTASGSGCTSSGATVNVTVNAVPAAPVISSNSPVCVGQTINLFSNTVPTATYTWSGPSSFSSALEDPTRANAVSGYAGTYSLFVTVNGCNSSTSNTSVVVNTPPSAPVAGSNSPVCSGNVINLTATTVPGATSYSWTGPLSYSSSTQNPSIPSSTTGMSGIYSVTAISNGCSSSLATVNVQVNATPAAPTPTSNGPVCQGQTVNLSQPLIGGATYNWTGPNSFSSNNQNPSFGNAQAVNAGNYNLTVTVNGCTSAAASTNLVVNTAAVVDAGANLASCNGAVVNLAGSFGGSASAVLWSNGTGGYSDINSATSTYTPSAGEIGAGSVVLTLTTDDPAGPCPAVSDVVTISISSSPSATFSYPNPTYCQSAADPNPVFPIGSSGGSFSSTAGLSINTSNGSIDVSSSTPGIYTVNNDIAANGSCPGANATTLFEVIATPATPTANNNGLICEQGTINLSTPFVGGGTYNWSGPNGFNSTNQNPGIPNAGSAESGTYQVVVTVSGCPSSAGNTLVTITPNPVVSISNGATQSLCDYETIVLTATGANSYVWSTTEITDNISVNPSGNTTYSVTGTSNGCSSTDQIDLIENIPPVLSVSPSAANSNCDSPTGSLVGLTVSGTPVFTYLWTDASANNVGVGSDLTNVSAGNYSVEVTDGNGCTSSFGPFAVSNFTAPNAPTANFDNPSPCINNAITGTAAVVANASYSWTGPNGFTANTNSFTIDPVLLVNSGSYCISISVNGCPSNPTCIDLTVNAIPIISMAANNQDSTACMDQIVTLNAAGGNSYQWTGPNGFSATGSSVSIDGQSVNQSGYYYVTGMSGQNCSANDSMLVTIYPLPTISLSSNSTQNDLFCSGSNVLLVANASGNIEWIGPNGFNNFNDSIVFNPAVVDQSGTYIVSVSDTNNCVATDSLTIQIQNADFGGINGNDELCIGETLQLTASGGNTYNWSGPNMFVSSASNVTIPGMTQNSAGTYVVEITDSMGCQSTDSINVAIVVTPECLFIPGLVTPDFDGHNDSWEINGLDQFQEAQVDIFNRWGNLVYSVSPYSTPWMGEINEGLSIDGKDGKVPFGTYFYLIHLNDEMNTEYKGYVELQY